MTTTNHERVGNALNLLRQDAAIAADGSRCAEGTNDLVLGRLPVEVDLVVDAAAFVMDGAAGRRHCTFRAAA